ncbi:uncharacterized protein A4U43_C10F2850 [Asparagus officinalis]|uniref:Prolyl endopeptidase n=1 Tax=Asparagus officinalis TaxID=4686 RepID=A0A5P1E084_ASPOF|nr:uncharacterized protein A4U43_C10F2850 [Asparagus officinalis]
MRPSSKTITVFSSPIHIDEDPEAEETKQFVEEQAALTDSVLSQCEHRHKLKNQLTALYNHPRFYIPFKRGGKYFYFQNTGLQAHNVLCVQKGSNGEPEVLLDPNGLSEDGSVSLNRFAISEDGEYLAYGISSCGSDWSTIRVMRVEDRRVEDDCISWVKFSQITWTRDGKGFFYCRFPKPKEGSELDAGTETNSYQNHELYYHFLGTDQSEDILCWRDLDHPKYIYSTEITLDGKYLLLEVEESSASFNKLYYCNLSSLPKGLQGFKSSNQLLPFIKFIDNFEARYTNVSNDGAEFTFLTNKNAPKYKLVRVNLNEPEAWTDIVPENEKDVLESARAINGNKVLLCYINDVKNTLQIRDLQTGQFLHDLPIDIGTVTVIAGRRGDSEAFIGFTSFLTPGIIYKCNLAAEVPEMKIFREVSVPGFDRRDFQVKQVFVPSKDGTKIPMFIVCKKNILLDGSHPALLYGYGGFNVSLTPSFNINHIVLIKNLGFIYCLSNIRGGGEYGEEWHDAATLSKKQNCFDDFIASAEFLISSGYSSPERLCIEGGSNGGILVAACINQRPDLFGCALAHVGVMDMLRFHKFTIGHVWASEFGCSDNEEDFRWLIKYSPLHNVRRPWEKSGDRCCQYPSTMLLTADHDDRVVPLHSLKLLATMQYILSHSVDKSPQTNPIVARIDRKSGHGGGRSIQKQIDEASDRYGFAAKMLGAYWID